MSKIRMIDREDREDGFYTKTDHNRRMERKKFRNFDNALRSKNVNAILEYVEDDDFEEYDNEEESTGITDEYDAEEYR